MNTLPDPNETKPSAPDQLSWREGDMPYSEEFGDFYYSKTDGRSECRHVFLAGNDLPERFAGSNVFTIGELGFGTGLNFIETWSAWQMAAPEGARLEFHSFELHLLSRETMLRALSAWPDLAGRSQQLTDTWPQRPEGDIELEFVSGSKTVSLRIHHGQALLRLGEARLLADAWYLDGFSPARNPEMWSAELLGAVAQKTAPGGTAATYSAAGWVRRNLQAAGFAVEKRPGHVGKRDMSVGRLIG
ncbi:tRNA (5-methylaminomethyl-2-thiouridine)(34)-methyltransferase MnmD [Hoeflea sp. G2-23]|uniref:tRNA (5-methylaminomethyl-2-thiouridine)(34)-methyltransferase MnmD n=1 Tax=Hoeflea algicola TaxID=2983763 RepID=A0ABT3ZFH1_9HYPH|nr:tRNA (5-methylaminomethyl-2-thiouridine)(34)-methyltransferase MnmD [Hoeflea algicola]MCY0150443.1 tRNA (5-methylaminomethyl-2-thiouridine)(34)-methyltransferase MnmD [Hoeflea algicola]